MLTHTLAAILVTFAADPFLLDGDDNLMSQDDFGIINEHLTAGIPYTTAATVRGLWAPPYVSSDFNLDIALDGAPIPTASYSWSPRMVERNGAWKDIAIAAQTVLLDGKRAGILHIVFHNPGSADATLPLTAAVSGTLDKTDTWEFARSASSTPAEATVENGLFQLSQGPCRIAVQIAGVPFTWNAATGTATGNVTVPAGQDTLLDIAFAMGPETDARETCLAAAADPAAALDAAQTAYQRRVDDLFARLPRLESDNPALVHFYNRSLVHLLTNRWDIPEFLLHPYYGTGGIKGGCVCNYLWNFGEVWEILPLYDPDAARAHIEHFLRVDIFHHFSFMPITGDAFGPWYPVNQEKIIGLIYYYVKLTGDKNFLSETVNGKTVLDHVIANALCLDDIAQPVALVDYGPSNSHLELRRGYPYNHTMPDLNGRRYLNYQRAAELSALMGTPRPDLLERADALARLLKERLWDGDAKWFRFLGENGAPDLRYTMQLFKLFDSPVLDNEEEAGLLSHLNDTEFLSAQGFHSMSKTDIAYDQVDIDNGGGGACTSFPPQIAERLYRAGHDTQANDILQRTLWWGERLPYWGDSIVANANDYRRDTPLQCTLDGAAIAQCLLFGMAGIDVRFDGDIVIRPHTVPFATRYTITGLNLRGNRFDIAVENNAFTVTQGEQTARETMGGAIRWNAARKTLEPIEN